MKTAVAETSLEAFYCLPDKDYLQPKEQVVMSFFANGGEALTRQQISEKSGMPINGVCGRVNSLLAKGVLHVRGFYLDPKTRKRQELLGRPAPKQQRLFA